LKSVTPPAKRGGNMPSFIPQPVTSPTRSPKPAAPTFARQPQRKPAPLLPSLNKISSGVTNAPLPINSLSRFADFSTSENSPSPEISEDQMSLSPTPKFESSQNQSVSPTFSFMSSPFATRLSTFTNFIPLPWASSASGQPEASPSDESTSFSTGDRHAVSKMRPRERCFVPRERQLERLKLRLAQEQLGRSFCDTSIPSSVVNI
jgi:hypothetical protein